MESLLQHYELPHESRQTHPRPQDTVPGLVELPSSGHSSCCTVSNLHLAFSYFLKGSVTLDFLWRNGRWGHQEGWLLWLFTPPHTWEADKYQFIGSLNFFPRGKAFPAQWCSKTPMSPTRPHQLCPGLITGGGALVLVPTLQLWLLGRGSQGFLVTTGVGSWCQRVSLRAVLQCQAPSWNSWFYPTSWSNRPWPSL